MGNRPLRARVRPDGAETFARLEGHRYRPVGRESHSMRSIMLGCACAIVLAIAGTAAAHEHTYIASKQKHGGRLVLTYDLHRAFPLSPDPTGSGFLGEDPAFNAQVTDDPADGLYRLKNHTLVKMRITEIDPGVSVGFAKTPLSKATTLTKPG